MTTQSKAVNRDCLLVNLVQVNVLDVFRQAHVQILNILQLKHPAVTAISLSNLTQ